jgi:hypothetical protein
MKPKRKKPFAAKRASINALESEGWTCWDVESRIPHTFITRDCFGFADILAMSPTRGIMLVQATGSTDSTNNYHAHVRKVKAEPRHAIWLACGGRIQIHSHEKVAGKKERICRIMEVLKESPVINEPAT